LKEHKSFTAARRSEPGSRENRRGGCWERDGERWRERKRKTSKLIASPPPPPTPFQAKRSRLLADWDRLSRVRVPLVAAVRGLALGGGFELALMCDLIVAGSDARFALPEVPRLGVIPGMGATQRLPRAIGKYRAMEMVLLGEEMGAEEAHRAGLVCRVVSPAEKTLAAALELAGGIAASPPLAVAAAKRAVSGALESGSLSSGLEAEHAEFWACFGTVEHREGMSAFLEKRAAKWPTIV